MQLGKVQFPIALGLLLCVPALSARAQEVQNPMPALRPLHGLEWRLPTKFATLSGDRLVIDIPLMLAVMSIMCLPALIKGRLRRWQGILLLCIYAAFTVYQCVS